MKANLVGSWLDQYQIVEEIGRGGMAVVYRAYQPSLNRQVALKVLPPQFAFNAAFVERFQREARSAAKLNHPHIVVIYDIGQHDELHYIVMEYLDGRTLKQIIEQKGSLSTAQALNIVVQIADALDYAHQRGLVHRDVKPDNIFVSPNGHVTLTDFGIVKAAFDTRLTQTGTLVGTPEYMSPEQAEGAQIDHRTDIYSLGVVLYNMLSGQVPFQGATPQSVLYGHVHKPPPPLSGVHRLVETVVFTALAKKPEQRFQQAGQMADALQRAASAKNSLSVPSALNRKGLWLMAGVAAFLLFTAAILVVAVGNKSNKSSLSKTPTVPTPVPTTSVLPSKALETATVFLPTIEPPALPPQPVAAASPPALLPGEVRIWPLDGASLVYIPSGEFRMGTDDGAKDEGPAHTVYLDAFWIDQFEVTTRQFQQFVDNSGHRTTAEDEGWSHTWTGGSDVWTETAGAQWHHPSGPNSTIAALQEHPVVAVSWYDAVAYCQWAGRRLPTEAEWEKAARGSDERRWPWGDAWACGRANFDDETTLDTETVGCVDGYPRTAPIGSYTLGASPFGVYDLTGNVSEWVNDWYGADYYAISPAHNPSGPASGRERILRGGGWFSTTSFYVPRRRPSVPSERVESLGFRCAVSIFP